MATVVIDPQTLPERPVPIPGSKPAVSALPHQDDAGHPEEADTFRQLLREIRHQPSARAK